MNTINCSKPIIRTFSLIVLFLILQEYTKADNIKIFLDKSIPQSSFAASEISSVHNKKGIDSEILPFSNFKNDRLGDQKIVLITIQNSQMIGAMKKDGLRPDDGRKDEGFCIRKHKGENSVIWVIGKDADGLMYGGLELAEILETSGISAVSDQTQNPYMSMRGVKVNIPLDVRTPSYSDASDAAQKNMAEMWNFDFWKEFIDNLARYRYNCVSLWNLHPFPSMVKVSEYPDVALSDIHQSTIKWEENYNLNGIGFDDPEIVNHFKVVKKMTVDEKIEFWRKVMKYGNDRNVQFYVITWNIFVNGTLGKYGITDKLENPVTRDYFRKSIKQMFITYPYLAGIGLTTGENMYNYSTAEKEDWAFDTYGRGVLDVLKEQPGRKITFIHRQHQTGASYIAQKFAPLINNPDVNFVFSFKYAQAHVYSSVKQVFHEDFVKDIQVAGKLKTLWTLRNDDVFLFRWGAPDFVRDFIKGIPYEVSEGFYYGSDQYVWGREFLDKNPEMPRQLETTKHWYQWMMWGRLGYNPRMNDERFINILQSRFPDTNAKKMFDAWQHASMIYPLTTGFHWGPLDFQWYIESGQSLSDPAQTPTGYHDVNRFITLPPHKGTGFMSIPDFVKATVSGKSNAGTSPLEVAANINKHADMALDWAKLVKPAKNSEMRKTTGDIQSMAFLGKYYAHKILGATNLALFRETLQKEYLDKCIFNLNISAGYWRSYAANSIANYQNPLWTNRVGIVDWKKTFAFVLYDITANGGKINVPSMEVTPGGTILEAEEANYQISLKKTAIPGFTGTGYLETKVGDANHQVEWTYEAPETGNYTLEFRYTLKREQLFLSPVLINGKPVGEITFWMTGNPGNWVWDRVIVPLQKGENTIQISPEGFVLLDHLNVLTY